MVLLEAMAFKKAIVSMNVGSISEVIINKETGFLINQADYLEFIVKLNEIKEQEKLIKKLGDNAFKFIEMNFNIEYYINEIESIYLKI